MGLNNSRDKSNSYYYSMAEGVDRFVSTRMGNASRAGGSGVRSRRAIDPDSDTSDISDSEQGNPGSLISVFQILIRNGQIHILSSEDESSDESPAMKMNKEKLPKLEYSVDMSVIEKNDISLVMPHVRALRQCGGSTNFARLIAAREMGNVSNLSGFGKDHRALINSIFLPNTIRKIAAYASKVFCGTFSKEGNIFLTACQDRAIRIYDTSTIEYRRIKKVMARDVGWSIVDTAFSPDGRFVAYSSWSEYIHIFNIQGETEKHEALCLGPDTRRFCVFSLCFSDDGNDILGGANDGNLYVYNRERNQRVLKISAHEDDVNSVAFADDSSQILFSAADDGFCKVWDRRTLRESNPSPVGTLAGHIDGVTYIDSKRDGRYLLTNSKDQSIKLWDMRVFASDHDISTSRRLVADQTWDYRWQRVPKRLCVSRRPSEGDVSVMTYRGHSVLNTLIRCHFSPAHITGQRYVYTGCAAGRVVIYDLLTGKIETVLKGHRSCVRDVSWHPYRNELASASWDNTIGLWTYEPALTKDEGTLGDNLDSTVNDSLLQERIRKGMAFDGEFC